MVEQLPAARDMSVYSQSHCGKLMIEPRTYQMYKLSTLSNTFQCCIIYETNNAQRAENTGHGLFDEAQATFSEGRSSPPGRANANRTAMPNQAHNIYADEESLSLWASMFPTRSMGRVKQHRGGA